jgi:hypothetical protein
MLRPAQPLRLVGGIAGGDGAVFPDQAAVRRLMDRRFFVGVNGEKPACAFDHDTLHIGGSATDQCYVTGEIVPAQGCAPSAGSLPWQPRIFE